MRRLRRSLRSRVAVRDSRRGRVVRPRDREFPERSDPQGPDPSIYHLAVVEMSVLRGAHKESRQLTGALLAHLAETVPELQGAHLAPLPPRRGPDRVPL